MPLHCYISWKKTLHTFSTCVDVSVICLLKTGILVNISQDIITTS